mmetsp:Transcript_81884/g.240370  ORF Transcript_81884/g.240370 Transcript_81884/m.240370 type:complete len:202 (-) Transcript_81884:1410-2015(-)
MPAPSTVTMVVLIFSSTPARRFSSFMSERSLTALFSYPHASMKSLRFTTPFLSRMLNIKRKSVTLKFEASQRAARVDSLLSIESNSMRLIVPSWFKSMVVNSSFSSSAFSISLSACSAVSDSTLRASVTVIMFSLTTAVRIDSMAHSLTITKIMKTTFVVGSEFRSGSRMLLWPSMTVNSTKMLSGTLLKSSCTSSGALPS